MQLPRKMSAQNVMASITRTLGTREKVQANEIRFAGEERRDKLYEPKHKKKLIRVLTVIAYIIFVSMAAIILSLYYTFLWDPKDPKVRMTSVKDQVSKPDCKTSDTLTILPTLNDIQIGKVTTAKSITTNETMDETSEMSTTLRGKSLLQILTETIKTEEVFPNVSSSSVASKEPRMVDTTITGFYEDDKNQNEF